MELRSETHLINAVSGEKGPRIIAIMKILSVLLAFFVCHTTMACAQTGSRADAMRALIRADHLRHDANARPGRLLAALEALLEAQGRILLPGGAVADVGYETLYDQASAAIAAQGYPRHLLARLEKLPGVDRGAIGGVRQLDGAAVHEVGFEVTFRGAEDAMVYVRGALNQPVALSIIDAQGRAVCEKQRKQGRVYCGWTPRRDQQVRIRAKYQHSDARGRLEVFTN